MTPLPPSSSPAPRAAPHGAAARHVIGLDALRFLAAAYVAFYHLGYWTWAYEGGMAGRAAGGAVSFEHLAPVAGYGWIGVQVFFVISGFVIAYTAERATAYGFLVGRIVRLVPCVWIVATVSGLASALIGLDSLRGLWTRWLHSVLFFPWPPWVDSVYWTLCVELAFYALVLGLIRLRRFGAIESAMAAVGLASTAFWCLWWASIGTPWFETMRALQGSRTLQLLLLPHGCFFALGVLLWLQLIKRPARRRLGWLACFGLGALLQIGAQADLNAFKTGLPVSPLPPALLFVAALAAFAWAVRADHALRVAMARRLPALRMLGLMTYPLYLLHNVVGAALLGRLAARGVPQDLALVLVLLAALAASYVIAAHLEPPLQRWTRGLLCRLRPAPAS